MPIIWVIRSNTNANPRRGVLSPRRCVRSFHNYVRFFFHSLKIPSKTTLFEFFLFYLILINVDFKRAILSRIGLTSLDLKILQCDHLENLKISFLHLSLRPQAIFGILVRHLIPRLHVFCKKSRQKSSSLSRDRIFFKNGLKSTFYSSFYKGIFHFLIFHQISNNHSLLTDCYFLERFFAYSLK